MPRNSRQPRWYGQTHAAVRAAQPPAASHPRSFLGQPARQNAMGSNTAGNALASAPAVSESVDNAGARLIIMSVATTPAMARASLWPLEANSTTTSGFQA